MIFDRRALRVVGAVFRTELKSVLRDRWTIGVSVLLPLLLYPTLGISLSTVVVKSLGTMRAEVAKVCLLGEEEDIAAVAAAFGKPTAAGKIETEVVPCAPESELGNEIGRGIGAAVRVPAGTAAALARNEGVELTLLYSSTEARGAMAESRVREALRRRGTEIVTVRVEGAGLPRQFASPIKVTTKDVAPPQKTELFTWAPMIIVFLVLFSVLGVFLPSIDLTAGDRERNTLETLMTSPARPAELILGKFFVVLTLGLASTLLNVASLFGTVSMMGSGVPNMNIPVSFQTAVALTVVLIPTVAMSGAVCMAIGCLARSFRDAQNYMTPVYLVLLMPAYVAALPTAELTTFNAAIPTLNMPLILKAILAGELRTLHVVIATVVDLLFCGAALLAATKLYGHEGIAFADAQPVDLLRRPVNTSLRFTSGEGLVLFAVCAALFFYLGTPITTSFGLVGVMLTLVVCVLAPPVLMAVWRRIEWRTAFALRRPARRPLIGAALLGAGLWAPMGLFHVYVQEKIFPAPPELEQAMRELLIGSNATWPLLILVAAITPAIAEELLFRGALLQAFRPSLGRGAVVLTAFLFAALHMSPWRFAPTFALGLIAGALVLESGSLWCAIVLHFVHNGMLVTLETITAERGPDGAIMALPGWFWIVPVLALAGAAALLLPRATPPAVPRAADPR